MNRGLFISFEGGDGSGKTTQIKLLNHYLTEKGIHTTTVREPGGVAISEKIRSILLDKKYKEMDNITEMLLYAASRAQLVAQVIMPALEKGISVICDRYVDSSYIYQGYARGLGIDMVKAINDIATRNLMPDITFLIDIDPETAIKRRLAEGKPDRLEMESIAFHTKVYDGYIWLANLFPDRIKRISGRNSIEDAFLQVKTHIDALLCKYKN
jgi:dTMP kinase